MGNLTTFIYDYIKKNVNDSKSKNWLPDSLGSYELYQKGPIKIDLPDGEDKISENLLGLYSQIVEQSLCCDKDLLDEVFSKTTIQIDHDENKLLFEVSELKVEGLENSILDELEEVKRNDDKGTFKFDVPLLSPAYDVRSYTRLRPFNMNLQFKIIEYFCAYMNDDGKPAESIHAEKVLGKDWPRGSIEMTGNLSVSLVDTSDYPIKLKSTIIYSVVTDNANRTLQGDVASVDISTDFVTKSQFTISDFNSNYQDYNDNLMESVQEQFNSYFVIDALLKNVIAMLNANDLRSSLSEQLTTYTLQEFDNVLGPVTGILPITEQQEKNAVDQYIFDRIRYSVCNEESAYNINKVLKGCKDPILDPWELGSLELGSLEQFKSFNIEEFTLKNIVMKGLSDMVVENNDIGFIAANDETEEDYVTMTAKLSITIHGDVNYLIENETVTGSFDVKLDNNPFKVKCVISGDSVEDFSFTLSDDPSTGIQFNQDQIYISLDIPGILTGLLENILNQEPVKKTFVDQINQSIFKNSAKISEIATKRIKTIFNEANKK